MKRAKRLLSSILIIAMMVSNINLNVFATGVQDSTVETMMIEDGTLSENSLETPIISENQQEIVIISDNTIDMSVSENDIKQDVPPQENDEETQESSEERNPTENSVDETLKMQTDDLMELEFVPITLDKEEAYEPQELVDIAATMPSYLSQSYDLYADKYSSYFIYNQLSEDEKALWDAIEIVCAQYMNNDTTLAQGYLGTWKCETEGRTLADIQNFLIMFKYTHPQYYYLSNRIYHNSDYEEGDAQVYIALGVYEKFQNGSTRKSTTEEITNIINTWSAEILAQDTEEKRVQAIHDKICNKVDYNHGVIADGYIYPEEEEQHFTQSAYSVFCNNLTVCAGYTQAFSWLCNAVDIEVTGVTSSDHAWNKVKVNGDWYNMDCTWDDGDGVANYNYYFYLKNDNHYDTFGSVSSHQEEAYWIAYLPQCTLDSGSYGMLVGEVPTATVQVATPVITAIYKDNRCEVTIEVATQEASVFYTIDGKIPSEAGSRSHIYQTSFNLEEATNIKALGVKDAHTDSKIRELALTFTSGILATGHAGDNILWQLDSEGVLYLVGNGSIYDYEEDTPAPWNPLAQQVTEIVLDEEITGIGANAFEACVQVEKITLSDSITTIGENAFSAFTGIEARTGTVAHDYAINNGYAFIDAEGTTVEELRIEGFLQESENLVYTGKEITQNIVLYYGDKLLLEGVDYDLRYHNNVKAATYDSIDAPSVTILFKGQLEGSKTLYYTILPAEEMEVLPTIDRKIGDTTLGSDWQEKIPYSKRDLVEKGGIHQKGNNLLVYEGENGTEVLVEGQDYTVNYSEALEVGKATVIFRGMGRYEGTKKETYRIVPNTNLTVQWTEEDDTGIPIAYYQKNGTAPEFTLTDQNGNVLEIGTDYNVITKNNRDLGRMRLEIVGLNNYKGYQLKTEAYVCAGNLADAIMTVEDRKYDPSDWKSPVEIREKNGQKLYPGRDYDRELIYTYDNMDTESVPQAGTSITVTATGKNCYEGSTISETYQVGRASLEDVHIVIDDRMYTGEEIKLRRSDIHVYASLADRLIGKEIKTNCYRIAGYKKNTNVGMAEVILEGKGDYSGERKCYFTIYKKLFNDTKVEKIQLKETEYILGIGQSKELTVYIYPQDAANQTIVWTSSDESVAQVDKNGLVTAKNVGETMIQAVSQDGEKTAICRIKVCKIPVATFLIPQNYKEIGDVDDTASFNRAISQLEEENCDTIYVPEGTYDIDAVIGIQLASHMKLVMSPDAILRAIPNSSKLYNVIKANYITNTMITGGQIVGERYDHGNADGEWGMGIGIYDSNHLTITDVKISNCWGDGIYIGSNDDANAYSGSKYITITDCTLDNNRRNNLSIANGNNVTIDNCVITNANGTSPEYGIDIETNNKDNLCEQIEILNSTFAGNKEAGLGINASDYAGRFDYVNAPSKIIGANDITVSNCVFKDKVINYAGDNLTITNTQMYNEIFARIGTNLSADNVINAGSDTEDTLVATFIAGEDDFEIGEYNKDAANPMSAGFIDSALSPSGKVLRMERLADGNAETGYYMNLADMLKNNAIMLEPGATYRFEYVTRGQGQWGVKTSQTSWYPCLPSADTFATGVTFYTAKDKGAPYTMIFFAQEKTEDMFLEIDSVKIYKIN